MVTVAGLFHVLIVLAEILGHVEWVVCIIHSAFVREPQPVALLAARLRLRIPRWIVFQKWLFVHVVLVLHRVPETFER